MIVMSEHLKEKVDEGVNTLSNAVKVTLGPKGRNVILVDEHLGTANVTKDGVSVARKVTLEDKVANTAAQILKEVANKVNDEAGDGTTTATVIAQALYLHGRNLIKTGTAPIHVKNKLDEDLKDVITILEKSAKKVRTKEDIKNVATISANGDSEIGNMIAEVFDKIGKEGVVTVEASNEVETSVDLVEGMKIDTGFMSPFFITNDSKRTCELENPVIYVTNKTIHNQGDVLKIMEFAAKEGRPLVIVSPLVKDAALQAMVLNHVNKKLECLWVQPEGFGEAQLNSLRDIAAVTNSVVDLSDLESGDVNMGECLKVIASQYSTTFVGGTGDTKQYIATLRDIRPSGAYEKGRLRERIAKIQGGVALIRVGATSEVEMREKKDRIEDAVHATRAALEEGVIVGGGVALLRVAKEWNPDELMYKGLVSPFKQICSNAGVSNEDINTLVQTLMTGDTVFDADKMKTVKESECDIIDPVKVTRIAMEKAVSVVSMLLTTEAIVIK